jgi:hypothetical protein
MMMKTKTMMTAGVVALALAGTGCGGKDEGKKNGGGFGGNGKYGKVAFGAPELKPPVQKLSPALGGDLANNTLRFSKNPVMYVFNKVVDFIQPTTPAIADETIEVVTFFTERVNGLLNSDAIFLLGEVDKWTQAVNSDALSSEFPRRCLTQEPTKYDLELEPGKTTSFYFQCRSLRGEKDEMPHWYHIFGKDEDGNFYISELAYESGIRTTSLFAKSNPDASIVEVWRHEYTYPDEGERADDDENLNIRFFHIVANENTETIVVRTAENRYSAHAMNLGCGMQLAAQKLEGSEVSRVLARIFVNATVYGADGFGASCMSHSADALDGVHFCLDSDDPDSYSLDRATCSQELQDAIPPADMFNIHQVGPRYNCDHGTNLAQCIEDRDGFFNNRETVAPMVGLKAGLYEIEAYLELTSFSEILSEGETLELFPDPIEEEEDAEEDDQE